ncbi:MAG: PD40 domain-containing protein [Candidatus Zixiibacteriota bacterium]|nr:MAG: PD40 domain-containing protein [candidate division Zixibacteria bacterium]
MMLRNNMICDALLLFFVLTSLIGAQESDFEILEGPYLGQEPPGETPRVFAPGIVSTNDRIEMYCTWAPDGESFYFGRSETSEISSNWAIWETVSKNGKWSEPRMAGFSGVYKDIAPYLTPDNKSMIFYRLAHQENEVRRGSWIVEKENGEWGEPRYFADAYCLMTQDLETFYFTTEKREQTGKDIAQMTFENGSFLKPVDLPGEVNSPGFEAHEYISPDGTYLLFDRIEETFVSFRKEDGTWAPGVTLGMKLHIPCISPDGKFIFFEANGDIYWVSASLVEDLRPAR